MSQAPSELEPRSYTLCLSGLGRLVYRFSQDFGIQIDDDQASSVLLSHGLGYVLNAHVAPLIFSYQSTDAEFL
jgi:hypothetical protein